MVDLPSYLEFGVEHDKAALGEYHDAIRVWIIDKRFDDPEYYHNAALEALTQRHVFFTPWPFFAKKSYDRALLKGQEAAFTLYKENGEMVYKTMGYPLTDDQTPGTV